MPVDIKTVLVCIGLPSTYVYAVKTYGVNVPISFVGIVDKEQLSDKLENYDAIIVRSERKFTKGVLNAGSTAAGGSLKAVRRPGAILDVDASATKNVIVLNGSGKSTPRRISISAWEVTCMLIGALPRWDWLLCSGTELYGKTLAIIDLEGSGPGVPLGMGAWGMKIIGYNPSIDKEAKADGIEKMTLEQIWSLADYITVLMPLFRKPDTDNLISKDALSKCKKDVKVFIVHKGGVIDEGAVLAALKSGQCRGAVFDVFPEEANITKALIQDPKAVATPDLSASTSKAHT